MGQIKTYTPRMTYRVRSYFWQYARRRGESPFDYLSPNEVNRRDVI